MNKPSIYDFERQAIERYPEKRYNHFWVGKYARMVSKIRGWQQRHSGILLAYGFDAVLFLVNEELFHNRSIESGTRQACLDWLEDGGYN